MALKFFVAPTLASVRIFAICTNYSFSQLSKHLILFINFGKHLYFSELINTHCKITETGESLTEKEKITCNINTYLLLIFE